MSGVGLKEILLQPCSLWHSMVIQLPSDETHQCDFQIVDDVKHDSNHQSMIQHRIEQDKTDDPRIELPKAALVFVAVSKSSIGRDRTADP